MTVRRLAWLPIVLLAAACGGGDEPPAVRRPPVFAAPVAAFRAEDRIEATGELVAQEHATLSAEVGGRVTSIVVDEGAAVEADAVVLEIDPERHALERTSQAAGVAESEAKLRESEREVKRIRSLHQRKAASDAQLDQAETDLRLARARLEAAQSRLALAERALRDSSVRAPFAGLIARREVSVGELVSRGQAIVELVALDPIEVEFHLTELESAEARVDGAVSVRVAPYPDEVFQGRVSVVSPTIDPRTRTLRVKAVLENVDGRLRPGLFARVDLGVAVREQVPMVPEEAILQRSDGSVLFVLVSDEQVERRVVTTGVYREGRVEVVSGVRAGERVVVRGQTELVNGSYVALRERDGRPAGAVRDGRPVTSGLEP
ncbi:MAG: efflux RND transporter periplasmic adaptor subunit [Proteobacteria bacterium]|nr:efflux RND transporter periplasmic adaptor subunit [Pseudomonadota bacterium]